MMVWSDPLESGTPRVNADINMIPLIDVMLVLLIIFIVTAPLLTHAIRVDLPQADVAAMSDETPIIDLALDDAGVLYWNGDTLPREALPARFSDAAQARPQPRIHLRASRATPYQALADVMAAAQNADIRRLGFITTPVTRE